MVLERVGARLVAGCEAVMDVAPVIRRHGVRLDPDGFHGIDVQIGTLLIVLTSMQLLTFT